jgi:DNA cross-link repair 1A protein
MACVSGNLERLMLRPRFTPPAGTDLLPSVSHVIARDQKRTFSYMNLKPMRNSTSKLALYGAPYSEHSSFLELTCFALSFDWGKMIATVNVGSATSREKMSKWFERWETERKRLVADKLSKTGVNSVSPGIGIIPFRREDYW